MHISEVEKHRAKKDAKMRHPEPSKAEKEAIRSNADLSDEELENRMMGREPGTSIIDQTSAGFALNNRRKKREGK